MQEALEVLAPPRMTLGNHKYNCYIGDAKWKLGTDTDKDKNMDMDMDTDM
jgi:hypothetical protein